MSIKKKVMYSFFVILLIICIMFLLKNCFKVVNDEIWEAEKIDEKKEEIKNENDLIEQRKAKFNNDEYYFDEIIYGLFIDKNNWKKNFLSKEFINKFKDKNILNIDSVTEYSYRMFDKKMSNKDVGIMTLIVKQNLKTTDIRIHYTYNNRYELDDLEVLEEIPVTDENGKNIRIEEHNYNSDSTMLFYLINPQEITKNDRFDVTENFKKKFPDYLKLGIMPDKNYIIAERYFDEEKNIEYIYTMDYDKIKYYTYDIKITEDGYIDDIYNIKFSYEKDTDEDIDTILLESGTMSFKKYQEYLQEER